MEMSDAPPGGSPRWSIALLETIISVIVVSAILIMLTNSRQKYETNWILISILPVLFWLFFSGRITSFKAFGVELKSAIRRLSSETIKPDRDFMATSLIEFEPVSADPKADVAQIQNYVQRKVAALYFEHLDAWLIVCDG